MKESKADRFRRVADARVNKIIKMIRLLGNCSGTGVYEYTDTQAAYIFSALQSELDKAKRRFRKPSLGKHRFSLTDTNEFDNDSPLEPTIALALPDGSYLRAVAYEDDHFPAINIYWDHDGGKASELLSCRLMLVLGTGLGIATKRPSTKNSAAPIPTATTALMLLLFFIIPHSFIILQTIPLEPAAKRHGPKIW